MKIAIGNDHAGYQLKLELVKYLEEKGYEMINCGADTELSVDYPIYGKKAAELVASGECDLGVLVCGTGIGISLAANKVKGIRAAVCSEPVSAELSRRHNNANMISVGARIVGPDMAKKIVDAFLTTSFEGGRHERRVQMITDIENREL